VKQRGREKGEKKEEREGKAEVLAAAASMRRCHVRDRGGRGDGRKEENEMGA
jgi:hypothetical protein